MFCSTNKNKTYIFFRSIMFSGVLCNSKTHFMGICFKICPKYTPSQSYDPHFGSKPPTSKNRTDFLRHPNRLIPFLQKLPMYVVYGKIMKSGVSARQKYKKRFYIISCRIFQRSCTHLCRERDVVTYWQPPIPILNTNQYGMHSSISSNDQ